MSQDASKAEATYLNNNLLWSLSRGILKGEGYITIYLRLNIDTIRNIIRVILETHFFFTYPIVFLEKILKEF